MKKRLVIILLLCAALMTSALCGIVAAADPPPAPTTGGIYGLPKPEDLTNISITVQTAGGTAISSEQKTVNGDTVDFYANAEKMTVELSNVQSGSYYLVVAQTKKGVPTEDTGIVYIDQQTTAGSTVTFTIYPSKLSSGECYVYFTSNAESGSIKSGAFDANNPAITFSYYAPFPRGDVNGDQKITTADAIRVLEHIAQVKNLNSDEETRADVNKDGRFTTADAIYVLEHIAQIRNLAVED
ncbi:MAG: hypothetical protein IJU29_01560 [Oscillospiraceae bacterium]|nr:hypothetical protein [Oscillospiraceae bacterium]